MNHNSGDSKSLAAREVDNSGHRESTPELDEINSIIEELGVRLKEPVLKSSTRMLIIITLSINKKLTFTELLQLTSAGKGSLSNHLERLKEEGLVRSRTVFGLAGPRLVVEITEDGKEVYSDYLMLLRKLMFYENEHK